MSTASNTRTPYIICDKVTKSFGAHQVLKGVSTSFSKGEVTVIIGASGSGKSTLLRAINRLEPHDGGTITIGGVAVTDDEATLQKQRCEVGMVFQQFNLFGHMTVLDNVTLAPRRIHKISRAQANAKAMQLLERVGMQAHAHKYPGSSRAASSSAWPLRVRWPWNLRSCCLTSPPRRWTPRWCRRCWKSCGDSPRAA